MMRLVLLSATFTILAGCSCRPDATTPSNDSRQDAFPSEAADGDATGSEGRADAPVTGDDSSLDTHDNASNNKESSIHGEPKAAGSLGAVSSSDARNGDNSLPDATESLNSATRLKAKAEDLAAREDYGNAYVNAVDAWLLVKDTEDPKCRELASDLAGLLKTYGEQANQRIPDDLQTFDKTITVE